MLMTSVPHSTFSPQIRSLRTSSPVAHWTSWTADRSLLLNDRAGKQETKHCSPTTRKTQNRGLNAAIVARRAIGRQTAGRREEGGRGKARSQGRHRKAPGRKMTTRMGSGWPTSTTPRLWIPLQITFTHGDRFHAAADRVGSTAITRSTDNDAHNDLFDPFPFAHVQ
jgi:hypothetical protein